MTHGNCRVTLSGRIAGNEKRRKATITGTIRGSEKVKGAPPPSRSLFISRVDPSTDTDDLCEYVTSLGTDVRDLVCISHTDSKVQIL